MVKREVFNAILPSFQQGMNIGARGAQQRFDQAQQEAQFQQEFGAQERARRFREQMRAAQNLRAQQTHDIAMKEADIRLPALQSQLEQQQELRDYQLAGANRQEILARETFGTPESRAAARAEQARQAEEMRKLDIEGKRAGISQKKSQAVKNYESAKESRFRRKQMKAAMESQEKALAELLKRQSNPADASGLRPATIIKEVADVEALHEAAGKPLDADAKKRLRNAAEGYAEASAVASRIGRKFKEVAPLVDPANPAQSLGTALGDMRVIAAFSGDSAKAAAKRRALNVDLMIFARNVLKAEPNKVETQEALRKKYNFENFSTPEELQAKMTEFFAELEGYQAKNRAILGSYGFSTPGLAEVGGQPSRPKQGPVNFTIMEAR